jgi:hypothetical protein
MRAIFRPCIGMVALSLLVVRSGRAQTVTATTCEQASALVQARRSAADYARGVVNLQNCTAAAAVLSQQWAQAPRDTTSLRALATTSGRTRDRSVLAAVTGAAVQSSDPVPVRMAAMAALVTLYDPCLTVTYWPASAGTAGRSVASLGSYSHNVSTNGPSPLDGSSRSAILATFDKLATDSDTLIASYAKQLAKQLRAESGTGC